MQGCTQDYYRVDVVDARLNFRLGTRRSVCFTSSCSFLLCFGATAVNRTYIFIPRYNRSVMHPKDVCRLPMCKAMDEIFSVGRTLNTYQVYVRTAFGNYASSHTYMG